MTQNPALRDLVRKIHEQSRARYHELHPSSEPPAAFHRVFLCSLCGGGSAALAVAVALITFLGLLGLPIEPWCEERQVLSRPEGSGSLAVGLGTTFTAAPGTGLVRIHLPSLHCRVLACLAEFFGLLGLLFAGRNGRARRLSGSGVVLALLAMIPVIGCELLLPLR